MAKYPELVPKSLCKTPIEVSIYEEGLTKTGKPKTALTKSLFCNYQDKGETVVNKEQEYVRINGSAYFNGDPFEEVPNITGGEVVIFGVRRKIEQGIKNRNPDGTVNNVRLLLL